MPTELKKITIYPNPENAKDEAFVIFADIKTGESYITAEYTALEKQYRAYWAAHNLAARAETFKTLSAARVAFASKMGYAPRKNNASNWIFQQKIGDDSNRPHLA